MPCPIPTLKFAPSCHYVSNTAGGAPVSRHSSGKGKAPMSEGDESPEMASVHEPLECWPSREFVDFLEVLEDEKLAAEVSGRDLSSVLAVFLPRLLSAEVPTLHARLAYTPCDRAFFGGWMLPPHVRVSPELRVAYRPCVVIPARRCCTACTCKKLSARTSSSCARPWTSSSATRHQTSTLSRRCVCARARACQGAYKYAASRSQGHATSARVAGIFSRAYIQARGDGACASHTTHVLTHMLSVPAYLVDCATGSRACGRGGHLRARDTAARVGGARDVRDDAERHQSSRGGTDFSFLCAFQCLPD